MCAVETKWLLSDEEITALEPGDEDEQRVAARAQLRKVVERLAAQVSTVPSSYGGTKSIHMSAPDWEKLRREAGL